jgi:hypothetical protein
VDTVDASKTEQDTKIAKELGLLQVKVRLVTILGQSARSTARPVRVAESISEKALKGRAISNSVSYVNPPI